MEDLDFENYKTLKKFEDNGKMERYIMFMNWKN